MALPMAPADPTSVVGRRIVAFGIDFLLLMVAYLAVGIPTWNDNVQTFPTSQYRCENGFETDGGGIREPVGEPNGLCLDIQGDELYVLSPEDSQQLSLRLYGVLGAFGFLDLVLLQGLTGASIGKWIMGLRVIREDGKIAGIGWAALRWILLIVDAICCFLPGAVLVFTTKGHRRIGDMAASTFVVRKDQVGTPPIVPGITAGVPVGQPAGWPVPPQGPGYGGGYGPGYPPAGPGAPGYGPGQPWGAPGPGAVGPGALPPTPPEPTSGESHPDDGPHWDEARDTYIQYDREQSTWVQWDAESSSWKTIDS